MVHRREIFRPSGPALAPGKTLLSLTSSLLDPSARHRDSSRLGAHNVEIRLLQLNTSRPAANDDGTTASRPERRPRDTCRSMSQRVFFSCIGCPLPVRWRVQFKLCYHMHRYTRGDANCVTKILRGQNAAARETNSGTVIRRQAKRAEHRDITDVNLSLTPVIFL